MPTIPYIIQKSVKKLINGRSRWFIEYETIYIDVSDEVAAFLAEDDKYEQDYQARMKKFMRKNKIHKTLSLDVVIESDDGSETTVGDIVADTVHHDNRDPLEIAIARETLYERINGIKNDDEVKKSPTYMEICASKMTKKQFEVWQYHKAGYSNVEIARMLRIDESSVRERLKNAEKRLKK